MTCALGKAFYNETDDREERELRIDGINMSDHETKAVERGLGGRDLKFNLRFLISFVIGSIVYIISRGSSRRGRQGT